MKIEIELQKLDGFEYTGEYRVPSRHDIFLDLDGQPFDLEGDGDYLNEGDSYLILRKIKPETQEDRVKAEYPDFDVVMLEPDISSILSLPNGQYHVIAQSMKGFYKYVYEGFEHGFYENRAPTDFIGCITLHPIAVLFSKAKS